MSTEEEWTVGANDALTISLVRQGDSGLKKMESFNPKFTYPIFGEHETIFGYKGLKINLQYNASDMRPNASVTSTKKFQTVSEVEAFDVVGTLKEYLPGVAFQKKADFELAVNQLPSSWSPPGEQIKTFQRKGETYGVWKGSLADEAVKQLVKRIQVLVLFYIEGGSYIGEDAEGKDEPDYSLARWNVYFLYKYQTRDDGRTDYVFHGYSTVYNFWLFQSPTPPSTPPTLIHPSVDDTWELPEGDLPYVEIPHRARISQFVILPPYQGKGCGAMLYNTIFETHLNNPTTKEITVEDPNEAFDLLRDLCDMKYLRANIPEFADLAITPGISVPQKGGILHDNLHVTHANSATSQRAIVDKDALEQIRQKSKIAPRQFHRLIEMHLMSKLPLSVRPIPETTDESMSPPKTAKPSPQDQNVYTLWRLLLKQRLYRRNAAILGEFEITERIIKLNETLENVEWEYARILERLEAPRPSAGNGEEAVNGNGKRKADGEESAEPSSKKVRVEDA
ncbi:histone acetyl transferase HAT1-like protein [Truncatella angustata]|uniref:Histone acetyltransferase type B catalytic subunit n=1 Tax=Truncatella angustata TaxID=152316 RepID=A0A9P8V0C8_9PEZI|nr:histone acetyl transferase HAT1-like protein [Truncatella angustata]KAH6661296.1 histone acetyl transferase HAT1-like protein [Truncatella angustata]